MRRAAAPSTPRLLQRHGVSMSCVSATAKRAPPGILRRGAAPAASRSASTRSSSGAAPGASADAEAGKRPCSSTGPPSSSSRASSAADGREIPRRVERQRRRAVGDPHAGRGAELAQEPALLLDRGRRGATRRRGAPAHPTLAGCKPTPALAYRASIAAACVVAAARLFPYLGDRVMHRDEALAVMVARRPLGELLETVQLVRGGAPLHFLLAKLVAELDGGLVATRAISALGLLLAIVAVGLLGRALGGAAVGAGAAWIVALSPVALYYGDFARMYSLFLAFSALALWCLVRALDTDEPRYWAATAALLVLNTYTHPYGVVVGLIAALAVLAELLQARERAAWRRPLYAAAGVIAGTAPLGIGYLVLASRLDKVPQPPGTEIPKPSLADVAAQAGAHFVGVPRGGRADRASTS